MAEQLPAQRKSRIEAVHAGCPCTPCGYPKCPCPEGDAERHAADAVVQSESRSEDRIAFLEAEVERLEAVNQKLWGETTYLFGVLLAVRQHAQMLMDVATPKEGS